MFHVAKHQVAAQEHIMNGTAISEDDEKWEVAEGIADPGGISIQEYSVPEEVEPVHIYHSQCVSFPAASLQLMLSKMKRSYKANPYSKEFTDVLWT